MIHGVSFEGEPGCTLGIHSRARWARYPDLGQRNSEREKSLAVLESLMSEDGKECVRNRAACLYCFFGAWYSAVCRPVGVLQPQNGSWQVPGHRHGTAQGRGSWGPGEPGGARGSVELGAGTAPKPSRAPCPTCLPAPLFCSGRSCPVPGGCGGSAGFVRGESVSPCGPCRCGCPRSVSGAERGLVLYSQPDVQPLAGRVTAG